MVTAVTLRLEVRGNSAALWAFVVALDFHKDPSFVFYFGGSIGTPYRKNSGLSNKKGTRKVFLPFLKTMQYNEPIVSLMTRKICY
nr:MAG TPA: hypothetical protein [Bacteriophage sp.]